MGFITKSLGFQALSLEDPSQPLLPMSAMFESLGLGRSDAGVLVNEKRAFTQTTFYSCIKVISEDLSSLPLEIYQTLPNNSLRLAPEHRLYSLLHDRPNPLMSSQVWRMVMLANVLSNGNGYSWIKRDKAARVISLVPLDPMKTSAVKVTGKLFYATTQTDDGTVAYIDPSDILHFMNFSTDGVTGLSPVGLFKNALGIALAAEKYGAQFFGNGMRATGVFTHPNHLDTEAYENIKKSVHEMANGDSALRPLILEEGLTWTPISIKPDEAQFIETRKMSKEEIAQIFRVPMHLLQDLTRSTNNNIEHQGRDYCSYCLGPRATNMQQEINFKLLGNGYYCEHNFMELQRGDFASQTTGLLALRNGGVYSANDVLKGLRQNPIPTDEGGDVRIVQGAFIPLDSLLREDDEPAKPETDTTDTETGNPAAIRKEMILASYRTLFRDAIGRIMNRDKPTKDFIYKALHPAVTSMAQTLLASQYGNAELTPADEERISGVVNSIMTHFAGKIGNPTTIATEVTKAVYDALSNEATN